MRTARPAAHGNVGARAAGLLAVPLLAVLALLVGAGPAAAHAELESSSPPDNSYLAQPPVQVSLTFGEDLLKKGNALVVTNLDTGLKVATAKVTVDGPTITLPWPAAADAGRFRVSYRVVSEDGHPVKGKIRFTIQGLPAPTLTPTPQTQSPSPILAPAPEDTEDSGVLVWTLVIGLVVLGAVGVTVWSMRRSRR